MFEALLERLLLSKLGKFISGLDRESLRVAVWQGDITLHNVQLSPDSLLRFQLPFILAVGCISELTIRIPWTRLTSSPIEITLDGLYVLLRPQDKKNWEYSEEGEIIKRKEILETVEKKPEEMTAEEELRQKSFLEKLMGKVVDNIRVTVKNIHFRLECCLDNRSFALGLTLESIESYTTDEEWNIRFTDRHKVKSAGLEIYKLMKISGLSIYWNHLASGSKKTQAEEMRNLQLRLDEYLIKPSKS
jgi:vacuolar protein sorting-associated protein 13A/C